MIGTKKFFGQTQKEINGLIHIVHPCVFPSFSYRCKNEVVKQNGEWVEKRPPSGCGTGGQAGAGGNSAASSSSSATNQVEQKKPSSAGFFSSALSSVFAMAVR